MKNYQQLIKTLFSLNRFSEKDLQLTVMREMAKVLGNPQKSYPVVHIAGTNGKGSVAHKIAKAFALSGYKAGLFCSPHISTYRERISINGEMISEEDAYSLLKSYMILAKQQQLHPTFFEYTTLLGFDYFAKQNVDIAIIEVGLGGRLDGTNIVDPRLSIITSIGYDHTAILGKTLEEIALEKAGIIKAKVPVVVGPKANQSTIINKAIELSAPLLTIPDREKSYDWENQMIVCTALDELSKEYLFSPYAIDQARRSQPKCRYEKQKKQFLLDVAHNPVALENLFQKIQKEYPKKKCTLIFGISRDKDLEKSLRIVTQYAAHIYCVDKENQRLATLEELTPIFQKLNYTSFSSYQTIPQTDDLIVVTGSFFIMKKIRQDLKIEEPCDALCLNERMKN